METHIAHCGLDCYRCPAYEATQASDRLRLAAVAARWSTAEVPLRADDVACDGCHSAKPSLDCGRCPVRSCAEEKRLGTCAECPGHPCGGLEKVYGTWIDAKPAEAKANLLALKRRRG